MATQRGNLQEILPALLTGRGGQLMTPEQIAREREIAAALMQTNAEPIGHWTQGAAGMVDSLNGVLRERRANAASDRNAENSQRIMQSLLGGLSGGSTPQLAPAFTPQPGTFGGGGSAAASPANIPNGDRAGYIREGLINRGLPAHVADAFIVNFQDESGLNPGINEIAPLVPGSRGGYGLYQLTGPRRRDYEAFASQRGVAASDVDAQLDWLMHELQGPEARAAQSILEAPDTATAAQAIVNNFLRPAPSHRQSRANRYAGLGNTASPEGVQVASLDGPSPDIMQALMGGVERAQQAQQPDVAGALMQPQQMAQAAPMQPYQPPAAPQINPAIIEALSSPYVDDQTRSIAQMLFQQHGQQQQAAAKAANDWNALQEQRGYDFGLMQEQRGYDRFLTGDQRAYDRTLRNEDFMREDQRNAVSDQFDRERIDISRAGLTPTSVREYDQYAADERAAGRQPLGRLEYEQALRSSGATNINNILGGEDLTPGQKKIDEAFADTYLSWNSGGFADSVKQLEQLDEALRILEEGGNVTGAIGLLPDQLRPFFNEQGTVARENVEEVVQRSLREILGAQFTEREGERLIARAFNPLLPEAENAKRVRRLMNTIGSMADAKQDMVDYFDQNGTLRGYRGSRPTLSQIEQLASEFGKSPNEGGSDIPAGVDPSDWDFMTPEERALFQ